MTTEPKFTGMVVVSGGITIDGGRKVFKDDIMTIIEMEALLFAENGEEYTIRMQRTDEVEP